MSRRDARSSKRRSVNAGLMPLMRLDTWTEPPDLHYDRAMLSDLASLRFIEAGPNILLLGPVGVGKTHLANGGLVTLVVSVLVLAGIYLWVHPHRYSGRVLAPPGIFEWPSACL